MTKRIKNSIIQVICIVAILSSCTHSMNDDSEIPLLPSLTETSNWHIFKKTNSRDINSITTFTANGIVTDYLDHVIVNDSILAVGSLSAGFSYLLLDDITNPIGKVKSYTGRDSTQASSRIGFSGFAVRPSDNRIFAWYDNDIVDVETLSPISSLAPDMTNGGYATTPNNRFEIDSIGRFWIGTSELNYDGSIVDEDLGNGLYVISSDLSSRQIVMTEPIWQLSKDSQGQIWVSARDGLYKILGSSPVKMYTPPSGWFVSASIDVSGLQYAIIRNYFANPALVTPEDYKLILISDSSTSQVLCTIPRSGYDEELFSFKGYPFIKTGSLYYYDGVLKDALSSNIVPNMGTEIGQNEIIANGTCIFSVGNTAGVLVYDGTETINLLTSNTAEGLIADSISCLYSSSDGVLYVGPNHISGFNTYASGSFATISYPGSVIISSFFEHDNNIYVQGANSLNILTSGLLSNVSEFYTNGEHSTYDPEGYIWAYPNCGSGTGSIGMMQLEDPSNIYCTKDSFGTNHWNTTNPNWILDEDYHFNKVAHIPNEKAMMIAVSSDEINITPLPYTLKYSHETNSFTHIPIPDDASEGIKMMASNGSSLYGVARQRLYKYDGYSWTSVCNLQLGNDFTDMLIFDRYAVIASGWSGNGGGEGTGIEVVDLEMGKTTYYTISDIPLPSDAVFALSVQKKSDSAYCLWFGTNDGLAYCDISL